MTSENDSCGGGGGDHRWDCNNGPEPWIYGNSRGAVQRVVNKYAEVSRGPFVPSLTSAGCGRVQISMRRETPNSW